MTAEEFLEYVNRAACYRDQGKSRLNRARSLYAAYVKAYREPTRVGLVRLAIGCNAMSSVAIVKGAEDRDEGRPMVTVPELLEVG